MEEGFVLSQKLELYVASITAGIRKSAVRERVAAEYRTRIEEYVKRAVRSGESAEDAFSRVRDELGDAQRLKEALASLHNPRRLPARALPLLALSVFSIVLFIYLLLFDEDFRYWLLPILQLALVIAMCILLWRGWRYLVSLWIRGRSYRRLKKYCEKNSLHLEKNANVYRSVFMLGKAPELTLETESERFLLYLFPTVRKRKTLRLLDNGLYSYWDNVGYMLLYTKHTALFGAAGSLFLPKGTKPFSIFRSDMVEVPRGMRRMPEIDWESHERPGKEAVRVLLLSPVPFRLVGIERGVARAMGDDSVFCGRRIFSFTGLISHLEGLRIEEEYKSKHAAQKEKPS